MAEVCFLDYNDVCRTNLNCLWWFLLLFFGIKVDLPERPIPPEMVIFYITQDTQRHPLLPEIKTGLFFQHLGSILVVSLFFPDLLMRELIGLLISQGGFRVTGKIATQCSLEDPLSGELTVEASSVPITSIDVHLLRVESIIVGERIVTETSLIQSTQVYLLEPL